MTSNDHDDDVFQHRLRISDVAGDPRRILPPIKGFEDMPLVSLEEAIEPIAKYIKDIARHAFIAKQNCKIPPADRLSIDQSASIRLYTMEWKPRDQCLYSVLNTMLRSQDRSLLKDWFLYLRLIISALWKLPAISRLLFRGVKLNLAQEYPSGDKPVWWAFSSCTDSMKVLENGAFLGKTGVRTLFEINCSSGRNICQHSSFPNESEILLLPARQFQILSSLEAGRGLHIIRLQEIVPDFPLIVLPPYPPPVPPPVRPRVPTDLERDIAGFSLHSHINLNDRELTDQHMKIVVEQAIVNKQCVKLSLRNNAITFQGISTLAMGISESTTLEELDLSNNHLSHEDLVPLARELSVNRVTTVRQWKCCGMARVKELEKAPIKILNLSDNNIGDDGATYLAELLKVKRTLTELDLNDNQISDRGVRCLANVLCRSTTNLLKLYLHNNRLISDSSVEYLVNMLKQNRSLNTLWLINCSLTGAGRQRLRDVVASKKNFYLNVERFD